MLFRLLVSVWVVCVIWCSGVVLLLCVGCYLYDLFFMHRGVFVLVTAWFGWDWFLLYFWFV